ncbi:16S rRNA (adenine(1518)-N(6)/adenine(1519)-N(6))-dimethyltransferase RsmA [Xanthomonadaceae bacterium XH05]|nr:16S rRNA (adenine(1518)-N(6)/adenine(1519)-N(6))-dimethyltransferase RsmA [Xanthomonadaceae bacterium XH05]
MTQHHAKKQLGQHFLHDAGIIEKIVRAIDPKPGDRLVEIGPGQGALTVPLLRRILAVAGDATPSPALSVIEFDRDLIAGLEHIGNTIAPLRIVHADVLTVDLTELAGPAPIRLVGNLPYNISSPILFHALEHAGVITDMHFMLQKEVVDRMAAEPGSKVYGRLSVMLQAYANVQSLFLVPPGAFRPPPKVDSAVVRLLPRPAARIGIRDTACFARLVKAAFGQRRKTLRNALQDVCTPEQMEAAGIDPSDRAERIDVARFIALANIVSPS